MDARLKSLLTLAGLGLLLIVAATWGWSSLTQPFPEGDGDAICVDVWYADYDKIELALEHSERKQIGWKPFLTKWLLSINSKMR